MCQPVLGFWSILSVGGLGSMAASARNNTPPPRRSRDPGTVGCSQQSRDIRPMLNQRGPSVVDDGPTLIQHWVNVSCLLGYL